jgi:hypothetical protein
LGESGTSRGSETNVKQWIGGLENFVDEVEWFVVRELRDIVNEDSEVVVEILNGDRWSRDVILEVIVLEVQWLSVITNRIDFIGICSTLLDDDGNMGFGGG